MVDGSIDFGNVRAVRTKRGTSREDVKPWPGIIAAARMGSVQLHGKHNHLPSYYTRRVVSAKLLAREMLRGINVDYRDISNRVGQRILSKLYETDA